MRSAFRSIHSLLILSVAFNSTGQQALRFIENKGQWPAEVSYRAEWDAATIWCEQDAILIDRFDGDVLSALHGDINSILPVQVRHHTVRLKFLNSVPNGKPRAERLLREHYNYFIGSDPQHWASRARAFGSVVFEQVAPGCDAIFSEGRAGLKYDLVVAPGADPASIRFTYEGADKLQLRDGALIVGTSLGRMVERIPLAYQDIAGERTVVPCTYSLKNGIVGVVPGAYDRSQPLVIDPTLSFATYSGSFSNNFGQTATFDQAGFLYAGSTAFGNQFPVTTGAYQTTWAGGATDIALTKYDTTGTFIVWSTYLGGTAAEMAHSLIVDANDELLVLGTTGSSNFPITTNGYDNSFGGGSTFTPAGLGLSYPNGCDMIVARLSADGSALLGSTYLGGSANDGLNSAPALKFNYADEARGEVLIDPQGRVWVVSCTQSTNAPVTAGSAQAAYGGGVQDGYAARLDPMLTQLQYASYVGGNSADATFSGEFDTVGHLFVCGGTTSSNLPVSATALDPTYNGGTSDAFVARFTPNGSAIDALTYWGAGNYDQAYFVELDQNGDVYLFGQTNAPSGQLISNAPYNIPAGGQFITKLDPALASLLLSSRIGKGDGTPDISPTAFLVDVCDKIYTSGWGSSAGGLGGALSTNGLPVTPDAHQSTTDDNDLYLAVFDINMLALTYATYYGGGLSPEHVDGGTSRFDRRGRVYQSVCAGCQNNDDYPTTPGAWSATNNSSGCNNAVLKFDFDAPLVIAAFIAPDTVCANVPVTFTNLSSGAASYAWDFSDPPGSNLTSPTHSFAPGTYLVRLTASDPNACNGQDVAQRTVVVLSAAPTLLAMADTLTCDTALTFTLLASSGGTADHWQWSTMPTFIDTLNASLQDSTALLDPAESGTYYVMATNTGGCAAIDSVTVNAPLAGANIFFEGGLCAGDSTTLCVTSVDLPYSVIWSPQDEIDIVENFHCIIVSPDEQMVFTADVSAPFGCSWTGSVTVDVSTMSGSTVSASVDPSITVPGGTVQLQATPTTGVTYAWSPPSLVSDPSIANPTAIVQTTTWFEVTVSDGICTRMDSVKVMVYDLRCEEPDIFIPNTFTPNGDGVNDSLYVRGQQIDTLDLQVFDRWGEKVFHTEDQTIGWDGRYQGKPVDPAVFVYHLTAWCVDGQRFFKKGNVTVLR